MSCIITSDGNGGGKATYAALCVLRLSTDPQRLVLLCESGPRRPPRLDGTDPGLGDPAFAWHEVGDEPYRRHRCARTNLEMGIALADEYSRRSPTSDGTGRSERWLLGCGRGTVTPSGVVSMYGPCIGGLRGRQTTLEPALVLLREAAWDMEAKGSSEWRHAANLLAALAPRSLCIAARGLVPVTSAVASRAALPVSSPCVCTCIEHMR